MIQFAYILLTLPFSCLLGLAFIAHPRGRKRLAERFGKWPAVEGPVVWLHGASVGEIQGLLPLIPELQKVFSSSRILLTATSVSGLERAAEQVAYTRLLPFDNPVWLRRATRGIEIDAFVFGETEIWPALLHMLNQKQIPTFLVNATISDFTVARYQIITPLLRPALRSITGIAAANRQSARRFQSLGVPVERIGFSGNTKYDRRPGIETDEERDSLHRAFFRSSHPVVVLGSLRPGELAFWLPVFVTYREQIRFIIAPRHEEKFAYIARELMQHDIQFSRWSEMSAQGLAAEYPVVLLDTIGMLEAVYSFAALAFIGATLIPGIGGHNPLEAAAYGVPVVVGPHYKNVAAIIEQMRDEGACFCVTSVAEIVSLLKLLLAEPDTLAEAGVAGAAIAEENRGATARAIQMIRGYYEQ